MKLFQEKVHGLTCDNAIDCLYDMFTINTQYLSIFNTTNKNNNSTNIILLAKPQTIKKTRASNRSKKKGPTLTFN